MIAVAALAITGCGQATPSTAGPSMPTSTTAEALPQATLTTEPIPPSDTAVSATGAAPSGSSGANFQVVTAATTVQRVRFDDGTQYEWEQRGSVTIDQASVGIEYVLTLADPIETLLDEATIDADGSITIDFTIPVGTAPGTHRLIVRDGSTGRNVAAAVIGVTAPGECITEVPALDRDGDLVIDDCDPSNLDGPIADADGDGVRNIDDNCPQQANPGQERLHDRSAGSACDTKEGYNPLDVLREPITAIG